MPILWTDDARRGAAVEFGKRHHRWWVAARLTPYALLLTLPLLGIAAVAWAARAAVHAWRPGWTHTLLIGAGIVLALLVVTVPVWRRVHRGYRMPSRWNRY